MTSKVVEFEYEPVETLTLATDKHGYDTWDACSFNYGIERFPRSFQVSFAIPGSGTYDTMSNNETMVTQNPTSIDMSDLEWREPVGVWIGKEPMLSGWIDEYAPSISAKSHEIHITGRGRCADLVDCSAVIIDPNTFILRQPSWSGPIGSLITDLCSPYGIEVVFTPDVDQTENVMNFGINLGETAYAVIERIARFLQLLVYENALGQLVVSHVAGDGKMKIGIDQNTTDFYDAHAHFNCSQRYSDYLVVQNLGSADAMTTANGAPAQTAAQHATAHDTLFDKYKRKRYLYQLSDTVLVGPNQQEPYQPKADWEVNRRYGRSQRIDVTVGGWRNGAGELWRPNSLVDINLPIIHIQNVEWLISEVTFEKGLQGTFTRLTCMPPQAFAMELFSILNTPADVTESAVQSNKETNQSTVGITPASNGLLGSI
jgi:prophage tail gpP-like protein